MNTRVFPGTLAPRYQELQVGNSVKPATVFTKSTQLVLGLEGRLDRGVALLVEVADAVGDPLDVLLDAHEHVGEHRRAPRAGDGEQVREPLHAEPEVGARAGRPGVLQGAALAAADVDAEQRAGHGVEPGGVDQHVEVVVRRPWSGCRWA